MEQKTQAAQSDVDVEAEVLRMLESGSSQREISRSLGISRRQISKLIDSTEGTAKPKTNRKTNLAKARTQIKELSLRREGVKRSELYDILLETYGLIDEKTTKQPDLDLSDIEYLRELDSDSRSQPKKLKMTENQYQYLVRTVKEEAKKEGRVALFVPEWMPTEDAKRANSTLVSMAMVLHERAQEMVSEMLYLFPGCRSGSVLKELVALAFPQQGKEPVERRCERNLEAASELEHRAQPQPSKHPKVDSKSKGHSDAELEVLCY